MSSSTGQEASWWRTSLVITAGVLVLAVAAWYAPWPWNGFAVLAAGLLLVLNLFNPDYWLRRSARGLITAGSASAVVPDFSAELHLDWGAVAISKTSTFAYVAVGAGVVLAALDVWQRRRSQPRYDSERPHALKDEPHETLPPTPNDGVSIPAEPVDQLEEEFRDYFKAAVERYRVLELPGVGRGVAIPIQLNDLYVPLLAMADPRPIRGDLPLKSPQTEQGLGEGGMKSEVMLRDAFRYASETHDRRGLVILGEPGSGKTTHLKRMLLEIWCRGAASLGLPEGTVPVFLPLRTGPDLTQGLGPFIDKQLGHNPHAPAPQGLGERLRSRGKVLYLLDGLDEVRDADERAAVIRWLNAAIEAPGEHYFLVTCRFAGYYGVANRKPADGGVRLSPRFVELHLRSFDDAQVRDFVHRWFAIIEPPARGGDPARVRAHAHAEALLDDLGGEQFQAQRVYALTRNPLLLTALCLVHREAGKLPDSRAALYEECVRVLLARWERAEADHPVRRLDGGARAVLQPVARWMHEERDRKHATTKQLEDPLCEAFSAAGIELEPGPFLLSIREESGLLMGWGPDEYGFAHLGFQEYLAAEDIGGKTGKGGPAFLFELASRFGDSWWQEVVLLMLARGDRRLFERFMAEVVRRPDFASVASSEVMTQCLAEAKETSARPFVDALRAPGGAADEPTAARQLAALQVLARTMPKQAQELDAMLRGHDAPAVQRWWVEHRRQQGLGGDVITAARGGYSLVKIPGGRFTMGSPENEQGHRANESPHHEVELSSFYLGRYPVTNAEYREYLKANPGLPKPKFWGDRQYNQDEQPVVGVSWMEANAYCDWARLLLPTEAQWEHACGAGTTTRFYSGDDDNDLARVGWYAKNSDGRLHAVGELEPNEFGLYDMHGNVWEWCRDAHEPYTTRARDSDGLRKQPVGGAGRVIRGGSWSVDADSARSACRGRVRPDYRYDDVGFRAAQGCS
ncbi:MAG: SUMF1/EgtB/PvdO family nonheme iron enzyme [Deltaproteobacteria bacterium]|nr:SUMF1/EgtB/PvdO family nonheme iron enzyme [Deltaproteobacteria bacterium]